MLKKLPISLALLLLAGNSYGGHNETSRKNCNFINARYKAEAHAGQCALYNRDAQKGCSGTWTAVESYDGLHAWSKSVVGPSTKTGEWHVWGSPCYWAGYLSPLSMDLDLNYAPEDQPEDMNDRKMDQEISYQVEFIETATGAQYVKISDIHISMKFDSYRSDLQNELTFTVYDLNNDYYHDDEESEIIYDDEIFYQTKLVLSEDNFSQVNKMRDANDKLEEGSEGVFAADYFTFTTDQEGYTYVNYTGPSEIMIDVSTFLDGVSMDNTNISFNSAGDCKPDEASTFRKFLNSSENAATEIKLFPNPATNIIAVENINAISNVKVYTVSGQAIPVNVANINTQHVGVNISSLAPGIYYMLIESGGKKTVKQFVKQ